MECQKNKLIGESKLELIHKLIRRENSENMLLH